IYLMRVINPPRGTEAQRTTVWLAAFGATIYVVDSITIRHDFPEFTPESMRSGARPPDASYSFSFRRGSVQTHALEPALVLNPNDGQEVSFTLGLAPADPGSDGGNVVATLHYHTVGGRRGDLQIRDPSYDETTLAKILGSNIRFNGLVVTPSG